MKQQQTSPHFISCFCRVRTCNVTWQCSFSVESLCQKKTPLLPLRLSSDFICCNIHSLPMTLCLKHTSSKWSVFDIGNLYFVQKQSANIKFRRHYLAQSKIILSWQSIEICDGTVNNTQEFPISAVLSVNDMEMRESIIIYHSYNQQAFFISTCTLFLRIVLKLNLVRRARWHHRAAIATFS